MYSQSKRNKIKAKSNRYMIFFWGFILQFQIGPTLVAIRVRVANNPSSSHTGPLLVLVAPLRYLLELPYSIVF